MGTGLAALDMLKNASLQGLELRARALLLECQNAPSNLAPVRLGSLTIWVWEDYLAVGDAEDSVRMPLTGVSAQVFVDTFMCMLPTRRIVDAVWEQATFRLPAVAMTPSNTWAAIVRHNAVLDEHAPPKDQRGIRAGHKKDVIQAARVPKGKLAIYGWHGESGKPIQGPDPNKTSHAATYYDYSHGIRPVYRFGTLDTPEGETPVDLVAMLADPTQCALLSDEGPVDMRYGSIP